MGLAKGGENSPSPSNVNARAFVVELVESGARWPKFIAFRQLWRSLNLHDLDDEEGLK
jgi:hypothetical protein